VGEENKEIMTDNDSQKSSSVGYASTTADGRKERRQEAGRCGQTGDENRQANPDISMVVVLL
jgi:hypothetical protein